MRKSRRVRTLALAILLVALVQLQPAVVRGTEAASESTSTIGTDSHWLSFLFGLSGGLGSYRNLSRQRGDPPSPMENGSYAGFLDLEFGLEAFGLGICYDWNAIMSPTGTYIGKDEYGHQAGSGLHRIKAVYALRRDRFHLLPEFGYVFLGEDASIYSRSNEPDRYREEYEDQGYYHGLSARASLIPILKGHLWLYARYVHDNLDIQVDNYQLELQLGGEESEPPDSNDEELPVQSGYFGLGVSWSKKTDGRSEWFVTLGYTVALGLL